MKLQIEIEVPDDMTDEQIIPVLHRAVRSVHARLIFVGMPEVGVKYPLSVPCGYFTRAE